MAKYRVVVRVELEIELPTLSETDARDVISTDMDFANLYRQSESITDMDIVSVEKISSDEAEPDDDYDEDIDKAYESGDYDFPYDHIMDDAIDDDPGEIDPYDPDFDPENTDEDW